MHQKRSESGSRSAKSADVNRGATTGDHTADWEAPPPPYELHSTGSVLASSAAVNGEICHQLCQERLVLANVHTEFGTVDVSFSGISPEEINRLLPSDNPLETSPEPARDQDHCPSLNIVIQVVGSRGK